MPIGMAAWLFEGGVADCNPPFFFARRVHRMRVAIFFDGKNFHAGWKDHTGGQVHVDFAKLARWITERAGGSVLWGAYYYTGIETGAGANSDGQKGLDRFLRQLETTPGYFVRRFPRKHGTQQCPSCGATNTFTREKEVDTTMVADMLRLAAVNAFDVVVLVSGDADHAPAADGVRALGKQVFVASWSGHGLAMRLRQLAYDHIDLAQGVDEFASAGENGSADASTPSGDDAGAVFIEELRKAELKFRNGYVGANYFVTRWKCAELDDDPHVRRRLLDKLEGEGRVEVYTVDDGTKAIRLKK